MRGKTFRKISPSGKDLQICVFSEEKVLWGCKACSFWAYLASDPPEVTRTGRGKTTDVLFMPQLKLQWKLTSCASTRAESEHGVTYMSSTNAQELFQLKECLLVGPSPKSAQPLGLQRGAEAQGRALPSPREENTPYSLHRSIRKTGVEMNMERMEEKPQHTEHSPPTEDYVVTQLCCACTWQEQLPGQEGTGV